MQNSSVFPIDHLAAIGHDHAKAVHIRNAFLECGNEVCTHRADTHVLGTVELTTGPLGGDCNYEAEWVRGGVVAVRYECEGCSKVSRLELGQHKGTTYLRTVLE